MKLGISTEPTEIRANETWVAAKPATVKKLMAAGTKIVALTPDACGQAAVELRRPDAQDLPARKWVSC